MFSSQRRAAAPDLSSTVPVPRFPRVSGLPERYRWGVRVLYSTRGLDAENGVAPGKSLNEEAGTGATITRLSMSKSERRQFEDFKRWKETIRDSPKYRESQEWQEWKAFRAWRRSAP